MHQRVKSMIDNQGVYVCGDKDYPGVTVVLVSKGGKIFSTKLDEELDPEGFYESLTVTGPFQAEDEEQKNKEKRDETDYFREH